MATSLVTRIREVLTEAGPAGLTKSRLLQKLRCRASNLTHILANLVAEEAVLTSQSQTAGRPSTTYYLREAVSQQVEATGDLTAVTGPDIPVAPDPEAPPERTTPCRTCGRGIAMPYVGRPPLYCSSACRDGGPSLAAFLARAEDPRVFAEAAICLVMADLTIRGYHVARHVFISGPRILITDNASALFVDVVPVSRAGNFPDPNEYEVMAGVYRDGRIVYAGRNNFLAEEPAVAPEPEPEPASKVDEPANLGEDEPDECPDNGAEAEDMYPFIADEGDK